MTSKHLPIPAERMEKAILQVRGQKVMLDRDLAVLYGVETRVLNQTVRRNIKRFPVDFMFELTREEIMRISQIVISSGGRKETLKFSKSVLVFTEQGVVSSERKKRHVKPRELTLSTSETITTDSSLTPISLTPRSSDGSNIQAFQA